MAKNHYIPLDYIAQLDDLQLHHHILKGRKMQIAIRSEFPLTRATEGSAGYDLKANIYVVTVDPNSPADQSWILQPGQRMVVPTGVYLDMPKGVAAHVMPRSGLAANFGVTVLNTPGLIDSDYKDEIKVILINHGTENFTFRRGDRIAQLEFIEHLTPELKHVSQVEFEAGIKVNRGGGFGSTGVK